MPFAIGVSLPTMAPAAVLSPPATTQIVDRCDGAATNAERDGCYLDAARKLRAKVERSFERNLRTAVVLDRKFNAFAKAGHIHRSSLAVKLKTSQAEWLKYSQSQCSLEGGTSFGGSGTDSLEARCHYRLNALRLSELRATNHLLSR
ncbi:MAG: lysozyme inhibitor LprI family protein [Pseudomonadota bacterium]